MNPGRHCLWKRYIPSLWNLEKPREEKVEFFLHTQNGCMCLKKGKKNKLRSQQMSSPDEEEKGHYAQDIGEAVPNQPIFRQRCPCWLSSGSREDWLWDGQCGRRGFETHSWLQQDECSWHLLGLALRMGKTNKQVCSKACRRNDISLGRAPLLPQGKKKNHPAREQELPANGRKLNGRTASAGLFFAFCQGKKKKVRQRNEV